QVVSQVPNVSNATTQQRQTINVVPQDSPPEFRIWLIPQHPSDDLRTKERPIQLHCNCFACRNKVWVLLNISAREHMSLEEEPVLWERFAPTSPMLRFDCRTAAPFIEIV
ncbi:hypothetical protein EJB05_01808, partial [Eragrostis curvula]